MGHECLRSKPPDIPVKESLSERFKWRKRKRLYEQWSTSVSMPVRSAWLIISVFLNLQNPPGWSNNQREKNSFCSVEWKRLKWGKWKRLYVMWNHHQVQKERLSGWKNLCVLKLSACFTQTLESCWVNYEFSFDFAFALHCVSQPPQ